MSMKLLWTRLKKFGKLRATEEDMKKFLYILPILLFACFMRVQAVNIPNTIKIGLVTNAASATISAPNGVDIDGDLEYSSSNKVDIKVEVVAPFVMAYVNGSLISMDEKELVITPKSGYLAVNGTSYRGDVVVKNINSTPIVVNELAVDDYVKGVVGKEIGYVNLEALKAQAVCARNYAISNVGKHSSKGYDLCTTTECQVYGGVAAESADIVKAVDDTSRIIATYNGAIAELVFAASTGGWTEDVKNVWGSNIPYLKAVESPLENPNATYMNWTYEVTYDTMNNAYKSDGIGDVTDIQIVSTSPHGAVTEIKVVGTAGSKSYTLERCRTFLMGLKSQAYTLEISRGGGAGVSIITANGKETVTSDINIKTATGTIKLPLSGLFVKSATGNSSIAGGSGAITKFVFKGRGYGHLVGLSQEGAIGMGKAGYKYDEILKHYYTGIKLEKF